MALLQRFYDPSAGSITIGGQAITDVSVQALRAGIGLVSQEPVLFAASIRENVRFGKLDATDEEVEEACRKANAHDFVSRMDKGYDTEVGPKGSQVSGGQKQRIAIARAIIRNPAILLLDEATSALDSESEQVVQTALDSAKQGRTTLVIAHRLNTVQDSHQIIVLGDLAADEGATAKGEGEEGSSQPAGVLESGTHDELLALKSHYYKLVRPASSLAPTDSSS